MTSEVVLSSSIKAVGVTIAAIVSRFRATSAVSKSQLAELQEKLAEAQAHAKVSRTGGLFRANIDELIKTHQKIESGHLTGRTLELAIESLELQSEMTKRAVMVFARG